MKEITTTQLRNAIKNNTLTVPKEDEDTLNALIILDYINDDMKNYVHHTALHGNDDKISASIALRMLSDENFMRIIYKAVIVFEERKHKELDKALSSTIDCIDNAIKEMEKVTNMFSKRPRGRESKNR